MLATMSTDPSGDRRRRRLSPAGTALALFLVVGLSALALWIGWVGFIASDDALYYYGANRWVTDPPFAGNSHWSTRFPVVLSLALSLLVFGRDMIALNIWAICWFSILVALVGAFCGRLHGQRAGWIAAILVGTLPVVIVNATIVNCDLPEVIFLLAGAWLLAEARSTKVAFAAGICFGLAMLSRETAVLSLAGLGLLFLLGGPIDRKTLLIAALGAAALLGAEMIFQYWLTGDPLHRYGLAAHHDAHIDRSANKEGNLLVHPVIDPLLVLLVNNEFGLLFWMAIPAAITWKSWFPSIDVGRRGMIVVIAMAATAFILVGVLVHLLVLNPRYFTIVAMMAVLVLSGWLARIRPSRAAAITAAIVLVNLLMLSLSNAHPRWAGEVLARAARERPHEIIAAGVQPLLRADVPLAFDGSRNVRPLTSAAATLCLVEGGLPSGGSVVAAYPPPPTRFGSLVAKLGAEGALPAGMRQRILSPGEPVYLVKGPCGRS